MFIRSIGAVKSCLRDNCHSSSSNPLYPFLGRASSTSPPLSGRRKDLGQPTVGRPKQKKHNPTLKTSDESGSPKTSKASEHGLDPDKRAFGTRSKSSLPSNPSSVHKRGVDDPSRAERGLIENAVPRLGSLIHTTRLSEAEKASGKNHTRIQRSNTSRLPASPMRGLGKYWSHVQLQWLTMYRDISWPTDGDLDRARKALEKERLAAVRFLQSRHASQLPFERMKLKFVPLLIGGLLHSPNASLIIMRVMKDLLEHRWKIHCDCLLYLRHFYRRDIEENKLVKEEFERQVTLVSDPKYWSRYNLGQACLVLFLNHTTPERSEYILETVHERYKPLPQHLIEVIVDYHIKNKDADRAIEMISRFSPTELQSNIGEDLQLRLVQLIRMDKVGHTATGMNFELLPKLIELGVPMTTQLHNEVIERAVELGLTDVAWQLFRYMQDNDIEVDARRHLVLLRHSFDREAIDDINAIMTSIYQRQELCKDPFLVAYAMKMVGVVCFFQRKLSAEASFEHMLAIYDRAYDRAPLVKLGLADPLPPSSSVSFLPIPTAIQLGFSLWAYILVQRHDSVVDHLWSLFLEYTYSGDLYWRELAAHTVLYDAFVIFYARNPATLPKAAMVLEKLHELQLCKPSERAYKFLVSGYLAHNQDAEAQALGQIMMRRGVNPTPKEWKTVLQKYSESGFAARMMASLDGIPMPGGFQEYQDLLEAEDKPILPISGEGDHVGRLKHLLWDNEAHRLHQVPIPRNPRGATKAV